MIGQRILPLTQTRQIKIGGTLYFDPDPEVFGAVVSPPSPLTAVASTAPSGLAVISLEQPEIKNNPHRAKTVAKVD